MAGLITTAMRTTATTATIMLESSPGQVVSSAALQRLLAWLSPSFPVGAFSYSHGLEWAIEDGTVATAADLEGWLGDVLCHGAGRNDAILFVQTYAAAATGDSGRLLAIVELAAALQPSKERRRESCAQGTAFLSAVAATWPHPRLAASAAVLKAEPAVAYPVAVAVAAAAHDVPVGASLVAYLNAFVANIVSAGIRAIPIGQTEGQRAIAMLAPLVEEIAASSLHACLDDLGGAAFRADIASMKHETQYTRLFRS
ncbi:MAG TPA: urease accessory protein UreF [Bauldia sp.]|nr:urease accessory protein UreF [Bauldia sp.]